MKRRDRQEVRGQTLVIFAIMSLVLFAIVGLGVDAGISFFSSAGLDRGSAASALAGVTYMPDGWSNGSANTEVQAIATKNGFTNGTGSVTVTACQVDNTGVALTPCGTSSSSDAAGNELAVKICEPVSSTFLRLVGFGTHTECRTSIAEYLRPITLGSAGNQFGGDLSNTSQGLGPNGSYSYFIRTEGYGTDRGQGDAYTPVLSDSPGGTCGSSGYPYAADGTNNCFSQFNGYPADNHTISANLGTDTSSSWPSGATLPANGGYNFLVYIPPGQSGQVEVYNPIFAPDSHDSSSSPPVCTGSQVSADAGGGATSANYNLHECDSMPAWVDGTAATNSNEKYYSAMSYTLLTVPNLFSHTADVPISQTIVKPIDAVNWNAGTKSWIDVNTNTKHSGGLPNLFHQWTQVCATPTTAIPASTETSTLVVNEPAGAGNGGSCTLSGAASNGSYYRLRIDTLDYKGLDPTNGGDTSSTAHKGMGAEVVGAGSSSCTGCTLGALNEVSIYTPLVASTSTQTNFNISMMSVPPEYRGQTIEVDIYDPGDISCTGGTCSNLLSVLQPVANPGLGCNTPPCPASLGSSINYKGGGATPGSVWLGPSRGLPENKITAVDCDQGSLPGAAATIQTQCNSGTSGNHDVPQNATSQNVWNGTWIRYYIAVPNDYNPGNTQANWFWSLQYGLTNASGDDTVTMGASYPGAPVHLVAG